MRLKTSKKIALSGMVVALNTVFLYASETIPFTQFIFAFLSSLFVYVLVSEGLFVFSWLSFLATALLTFLILPSRTSWFFYVGLIGHFGIVRQFLCDKVNTGWVRSILLVLYCNIGCALASFILFKVAGVNILTLLPNINVILLVIVAEICFFLLDIIYNICTKFYNRRLRKWLVV